MIAKVIGCGSDRDAAIQALRDSLDAVDIEGITHNGAFLAAVLDHPRFRAGDISTAFIAEAFSDGFDASVLSDEMLRLFAAVASAVHVRLQRRAAHISGRLRDPPRAVPADWIVRIAEHSIAVSWRSDADMDHFVVDGVSMTLAITWDIGAGLLTVGAGDRRQLIGVRRETIGYWLRHGAARSYVRVLRPRIAALDALMPAKASSAAARDVRSPMPGLLLSLAVGAGDEVKVGQELAVIEAMKMENVLRATRAGTVESLSAEPGANLAVDEVILRFADEPAD